jgi:hypothetical protein
VIVEDGIVDVEYILEGSFSPLLTSLLFCKEYTSFEE